MDKINKHLSKINPKIKNIACFPTRDKKPQLSDWNNVSNNVLSDNEQSCGIRCGAINDFFVIDVDKPDEDEYDGALFLEEFNDLLSNTLTIFTPSGGKHYYYKYTKEIANLCGIGCLTYDDKAVSIDILADNRQVNFSKDYYTIEDKPIQEIPDEILDKIKQHFYRKKKTTMNVKASKRIDFLEVQDILNHLNKARACKFQSWFDMGCVLANMGNKHDDWYQLFDEFSMKCKEHYNKDDKNKEIWDGIKVMKNGKGKKELVEWLLEDNPDKYNEMYPPKWDDFNDYTNLLHDVIDESEVIRFMKDTMYYIVNNGESFFVVKGKDNNGEVIFQPLKKLDVEGQFRFLKYNGKTKNEEILYMPVNKFFKNNAYLIKYNKIEFLPYSPLEDNPIGKGGLNTFTGYRWGILPKDVVEKNKQLIQPFLTHIKEVICDNDEISYQYQLKYWAYIIQYPRDRHGIANIYSSTKQGAGKNIFCDELLSRIFGKYYLLESNPGRILKQFNALYANKLVIVLDELESEGQVYKCFNQMKAMLTQKTLNVERKGKEAYTTKDYSNYVLNTNNISVARIEVSDRRYNPLACSNKYIGNKDYFDTFGKAVNDDFTIQVFFNYLLYLDLTKFNIRYIPMTKTKKEQIRLCAKPHIHFLEFILINKHLREFSKDSIYGKALYEHYKNYMENDAASKFKLSNMKFYSEMKTLGIQKTIDNKGTKYCISTDDLEKILKKYYNDDDWKPYTCLLTDEVKPIPESNLVDEGNDSGDE